MNSLFAKNVLFHREYFAKISNKFSMVEYVWEKNIYFKVAMYGHLDQ